MEWLVIRLLLLMKYGDAKSRKLCLAQFQFPTAYSLDGEKTSEYCILLLLTAGIKPGLPAEQASTPSITPLSHLYHVSKPTWLREQLDGSPIGNAGRFICRYKSQCCLHWVVPTRASWDNAKIIKARYSTVVGQYWHQDLVRALIGNKSFGSAVH